MMTKCDEDIRVHIPSELKDSLFRLAEAQDRSLSDYVRHVLSLHVWGHRAVFAAEVEGTERGNPGKCGTVRDA